MLATRRSHAYRAPAAFPKCGRQAPRKTNRVAVCHRAPARLRAAFLSSSSGASIPARHGPLPLCRPGTSHLKQPTQEGSHARRPRGHVAPASSITRPRAARPACRLPSPPERAALTVVATPTAIARLRACALRRARPVPPIARMCAHAPRRMLHVKHLFLLYDGADEPNAKGRAWTMRRGAQRKRFAHG